MMAHTTGTRRLRTNLLHGLLLSVALLGAAAGRATDFDFAQLQRQISEQQVHSVEGLIGLLPVSMRSHYVLLFASRSLQSASYENPRAILYGDDAQFIVTFNGHPRQRGFDAVEVAQFQASTQSFELREIRFSADSGAPIEYSAANPPQCLGCHGSPARTLWDSAPLWPGAYGERYLQPLSAPEKVGITKFLEQQPTNPRYRALLGAERFGLRDLYVPDAHSRYDGNAEEPPNADFSRLLGDLNARRIVAQLSNQPGFRAFQYALLGAAEADCGALFNFLPANTRVGARAGLEQISALTRSANARAALIRRQRLSTFADLPATAGASHGASLTELRYLSEDGLGLSTRAWTLAIEQDSYDFSTPGPTTNALAELLRERLLATDPQLGALVAYRTHSPEDAYCNYLQRMSVHALEAPALSSAHWSGTATPVVSPGALLQACAACHEGHTAPALPFADDHALALHLHDRGYPHGELLDEIEFRLTPQSGAAHMPLNDNLDEPSRKSLAQYLESLASTTPTL
jgi:mono/diheme cytochrome c family protein